MGINFEWAPRSTEEKLNVYLWLMFNKEKYYIWRKSFINWMGVICND